MAALLDPASAEERGVAIVVCDREFCAWQMAFQVRGGRSRKRGLAALRRRGPRSIVLSIVVSAGLTATAVSAFDVDLSLYRFACGSRPPVPLEQLESIIFSQNGGSGRKPNILTLTHKLFTSLRRTDVACALSAHGKVAGKPAR